MITQKCDLCLMPLPMFSADSHLPNTSSKCLICEQAIGSITVKNADRVIERALAVLGIPFEGQPLKDSYGTGQTQIDHDPAFKAARVILDRAGSISSVARLRNLGR